MIKKILISLKLLFIGLTISSSASALDCDFTNLIGGKIPLNFGFYNPLETNALQISTDINFECGPDIFFVTPYTIELVITGGNTQNGSRVILGPAGKNLQFILATDQQCLNEIKNNAVIFTRVDQFPRKRTYRFTIFGCVFPGQDVSVGQYQTNLRSIITTRRGR
jgi:spore coat protein U-like protein